MDNLIAVAIPVFVVMIAAEIGWAVVSGRQRGDRPVYRWVDALTDLSCGVVSQVTGIVLFLGGTVVAYGALYGSARGVGLPSVVEVAARSGLPGWAIWIVVFVAVDFLYYWWHRASHRVNLLWAAHIVHHQSEDYNLAVALRQSVLTGITTLPFYAPLAILGVPTEMFLGCQTLNTLYQFWIHTRLIGTVGPLEEIINTAAHHRVHHGINPACIDRNHAGVFIVWDKWFGTFTDERVLGGAEPVYGTVEGFASADPIRANLDPVRKLLRLAWERRGTDRLWTLFGPPEWRPEGAAPLSEPQPGLRWRPETTIAEAIWTGGWFLASAAGLGWLLEAHAHAEAVSSERLAAVGALLIWTCASAGWRYDINAHKMRDDTTESEKSRSRGIEPSMVERQRQPLASIEQQFHAIRYGWDQSRRIGWWAQEGLRLAAVGWVIWA